MLGAARVSPTRILIVADEAALSSSLAYSLEGAGYEVKVVTSGGEALRVVANFLPHLILLDIMLPDVSGFEVCRRIRTSDLPAQPAVIILTAKTQETDRVAGFEVGADDFVAKPFSVRELMLRIQVRLGDRRVVVEYPAAVAKSADRGQRLTVGPLEIDQSGHRVFLGGQEIGLSAKEMRLLAYLASSPGKMRTRRELLAEVWGYNPETPTRTLDTHIKRLRDKFGALSGMIQTVHGVGYRLAQPTRRNRSVTSQKTALRRR